MSKPYVIGIDMGGTNTVFGIVVYLSMDELLDFIMTNAPGDKEEIATQREHWRKQLLTLKYWKGKE